MDRNLSQQDETVSEAVRRNIELMCKLEGQYLSKRTAGERLADAIADFAGSVMFVGLHALVFALWIGVNLGWMPFVPVFDPYPFLLLSVLVSLEAIFLATFVLIKQNRMSRRAEQRAHLDLHINLLAEKEMTLVLQMLHRISTRLGVRLSGQEIHELSEETPVEALASELDEKLPGE